MRLNSILILGRDAVTSQFLSEWRDEPSSESCLWAPHRKSSCEAPASLLRSGKHWHFSKVSCDQEVNPCLVWECHGSKPLGLTGPTPYWEVITEGQRSNMNVSVRFQLFVGVWRSLSGECSGVWAFCDDWTRVSFLQIWSEADSESRLPD